MKKVKKIVIYGDSISTKNHGEGGYEGFLRGAFRAETVNYAIGSSGLSFITPNNTASILMDQQNIHEDADVILMWHGSNDWYWGCPLGEVGDRTPDTFYGAIDMAVHCIREKAPSAVLTWVTPIYRLENPAGVNVVGKAYETKNRDGHTLEEYYQALMRASVHHGFPIIDMRKLCGIHEGNQDQYLEDRVHPNKAGYERISRVLERGLKELLYYGGYEV